MLKLLFTALFTLVTCLGQFAFAGKSSELMVGGSYGASDDRDSQFGKSTSVFAFLSGSYLFIFDSIEAGPTLSYLDSRGRSFHSWNIAVGPTLKFNFADINRDMLVPYALIRGAIGKGASDDGDKSDSTLYGAGLGLSTFLARGAAVNFELSHTVEHTKTDLNDDFRGDSDRTERDKDTDLLIGLSLFMD